MKYIITRIDKHIWHVDTNLLDPFSDLTQLCVIGYADGNNCKVTDDGYTNYNLTCLGKKVGYKEIKTIGKWDDRDELIEQVLQKIISAYDKCNIKTYWYKDMWKLWNNGK